MNSDRDNLRPAVAVDGPTASDSSDKLSIQGTDNSDKPSEKDFTTHRRRTVRTIARSWAQLRRKPAAQVETNDATPDSARFPATRAHPVANAPAEPRNASGGRMADLKSGTDGQSREPERGTHRFACGQPLAHDHCASPNSQNLRVSGAHLLRPRHPTCMSNECSISYYTAGALLLVEIHGTKRCMAGAAARRSQARDFRTRLVKSTPGRAERTARRRAHASHAVRTLEGKARDR